MVEVRCPTCDKLIGCRSPAFDGEISFYCRRCKSNIGPADLPRLRCECRKFVALGIIRAGFVRVACPRCGMLVDLTGVGPRRVDTPQKPGPKLRLKPASVDEVVRIVQERWALLRLDKAHRSADRAVGLRFDVFSRDSFRCRYCGRTPDEGAILEMDHIEARANGGTDEMSNLTTACWECNRGKSAKAI